MRARRAGMHRDAAAVDRQRVAPDIQRRIRAVVETQAQRRAVAVQVDVGAGTDAAVEGDVRARDGNRVPNPVRRIPPVPAVSIAVPCRLRGRLFAPQHRVVHLQPAVRAHALGVHLESRPGGPRRRGRAHRVVRPGLARETAAEVVRVAAQPGAGTVVELQLELGGRAGEAVVVEEPRARRPRTAGIELIGHFLPRGSGAARARPRALERVLPVTAVRAPLFARNAVRVAAPQVRIALLPVVGADVRSIRPGLDLEAVVPQQRPRHPMRAAFVPLDEHRIVVQHAGGRARNGRRVRVRRRGDHPLDQAVEVHRAADGQGGDCVRGDVCQLDVTPAGPVVRGVHEPQLFIGSGVLRR